MQQQSTRPKFLSLFTLAPRMSITAKISILHRLSGVLLFLAIPFILFLFHHSLTNPHFYETFYLFATSWCMKTIYIVLIWAFIYHLCSGVRFLFLDVSKGVEIKTARKTAMLVLIVSTLITIFLGVLIW